MKTKVSLEAVFLSEAAANDVDTTTLSLSSFSTRREAIDRTYQSTPES